MTKPQQGPIDHFESAQRLKKAQQFSYNVFGKAERCRNAAINCIRAVGPTTIQRGMSWHRRPCPPH